MFFFFFFPEKRFENIRLNRPKPRRTPRTLRWSGDDLHGTNDRDVTVYRIPYRAVTRNSSTTSGLERTPRVVRRNIPLNYATFCCTLDDARRPTVRTAPFTRTAGLVKSTGSSRWCQKLAGGKKN